MESEHEILIFYTHTHRPLQKKCLEHDFFCETLLTFYQEKNTTRTKNKIWNNRIELINYSNMSMTTTNSVFFSSPHQ